MENSTKDDQKKNSLFWSHWRWEKHLLDISDAIKTESCDWIGNKRGKSEMINDGKLKLEANQMFISESITAKAGNQMVVSTTKTALKSWRSHK